MAISSSNTFNLPAQGDSLVLSRENFNNSLRALLQNFYSTGIPDTENFTNMGSAMTSADINGVLYRSSNTGMLYISDTAIASDRTNNPVGGKFTRYGIAWRQQGSLAAAAANINSFDLGEAFVVVNHPTAANNRMYLRTKTSTGTMSDFIDVGSPPGGSASFTGDVTATDGNFITTGSVNGNRGVYIYNTSTGGSSQSVYLASAAGATGVQFGQARNKDAFIYNGDTSNIIFSSAATERMRVSDTGTLEIGGSRPARAGMRLFVAGGISQVNDSVRTGSNARNYGITLWNDAAYGMELGWTGNNGWTNRMFTRNDSDMEFGQYVGTDTLINQFVPRMTITALGNVGINSTTASARLYVAGDIKATGDITAFFSDDRLKNKLGNIKDSLNKVKQLTGFYYEANETAKTLGYESKRDVGVSAQEVQLVLPEAVVAAPISDEYLTVHYHKIIPLIIEAIKEIDERLTNLERNL